MNQTTDLSFKHLPIAAPLLAVLEQLTYTQMSPIQAASLPHSLAGKDVIAQAKTGSGKTIAFALPLLSHLNQRWFAIQSLVLCPTRELAEQVAQEIRRLARNTPNVKVITLCGGSPMGPQIGSLEHGGHIVVGTPGRIMDHLERGTLNLRNLKTLVFDEADRMLDMGFLDSIRYIMDFCPLKRQTLMFSATYPDGVANLASKFMYHPEFIRLPETHAPQKIQQYFVSIDHEARLESAGKIINHYRPDRVLLFCNTKERCRMLCEALTQQGIRALTLNGDMDQKDRDQVLIQFSQRSCTALVATDVAARGLDIDQLEMVINIELPGDPEVYVHRIGRTGRGEHSGMVFNLCSTRDEKRIEPMCQQFKITPEWLDVYTFQAHDTPLLPEMVTLHILGGKKQKMRAGDVLGALTADIGLTREQVGKINITEFSTYVAVARNVADEVVHKLNQGKIKGRNIKVRALE